MVNIEDIVKQHQEQEAAAAHGEVKKKKGYDNVKMEDMEQDFLSSRRQKSKHKQEKKASKEKSEEVPKTAAIEKMEKIEKIESKTIDKEAEKKKKSKEKSVTLEPDKASIPATTKLGSNESTGGKGSKDGVTKTGADGASEEPTKGGRREGSAKCCSIL